MWIYQKKKKGYFDAASNTFCLRSVIAKNKRLRHWCWEFWNFSNIFFKLNYFKSDLKKVFQRSKTSRVDLIFLVKKESKLQIF